jgi:threonine/homoserine/homoserine lactone efflux protein
VFPAIVAALVYGLSAGLTPGPLFALVLRQTLLHGAKAGIRTSFAPLLTDLPIVLLVLIAVDRLQRFRPVLGVIGLIGAGYLLFLAYETWKSKADIPVANAAPGPQNTLTNAVIVNYLNPNPWLFWITVGTPVMTRARGSGWYAVIAFIVVFLALLVGSKILLAVAVARSRDAIIGRWYRPAMRILAVLLAVFAVMTAYDAVALLRS